MITRLFALIALLLFTTSVSAAEKVMLVLDVSGSMWGQINGVTKIEIARNALASLVDEWDDGRDVGLVAYGHREKGNCADIEVVVPVGPLDTASMKSIVSGLKPKGKTPLSDAVVKAAESLRFTENKATVVLISDGVETCERDPCKVGAELEELGVDFTAHVIGFDIRKLEDQAGLRCLAENTGGRFISADNAGELTQALEQTAKAEEPAPLPLGSIGAADAVIKGTEFEVVIKSDQMGIGGYVYLFARGQDKAAAYGYVEDDNSSYRPITLRMPAVAGDYELRWLLKDGRAVATRPIGAIESDITITAPSTAVAGTEIGIEVDAPPGLNGYLYLYPAGAEQAIAYTYVRAGTQQNYQTSTLRLPASEGLYDIRWLSSDLQEFAETSVQALSEDISLQVPDHAIAGTEFSIALKAPQGLGGYLYLYHAGSDKSLGYTYAREDNAGGYQDAVLRLPNEAGDYVVKWISPKKEELAVAALSARKLQSALNAPDSAQAGTEVSVSPTGPQGLDGYIYLYPEESDRHIAYAYVRESATGEYQDSTLQLPANPGRYTLKWTSAKKEVIAERLLTITEIEAALEAPETATIATEVDVIIKAPPGLDGQIQLYLEGQKRHLAYGYVRVAKSGGYQPTAIRLPATPGNYELRWISGRNELIAERSISLEPAQIKINPPGRASAANEIEVVLQAPAGIDGQIQLFTPGGKKYLAYAYVKPGRVNDYDPVPIVLVGTPGEYELRWISSRRELLAEAPITVLPIGLEIESPAQVETATLFETTVGGSPGANGRVLLIREADGKAVTSRNLSPGTNQPYAPIRLKSPPEPGQYRLRIEARDKTVLLEKPITVIQGG